MVTRREVRRLSRALGQARSSPSGLRRVRDPQPSLCRSPDTAQPTPADKDTSDGLRRLEMFVRDGQVRVLASDAPV